MKLVIATSNEGKCAELAGVLQNIDVELYSLADFPEMPEIIENGSSFLENALIKAHAVSSFSGLITLADDSGLEVYVLGGQPGVLSARFAQTVEARNRKVLELLEGVSDDCRTARFICALALVRPDGFEWTTTGSCEGRIIKKPVGVNGFGYDPIFYYDPLGATFAEIPREIKNRVSHRGRAIEAFKKAVLEEGILGNAR